ncbi:MAG: T9SS type A sorting domain-containing protein [Bacteroidales bacterium]|nr:T9SS type A sorting domain-containing protein [Bacteroidales bacterium]
MRKLITLIVLAALFVLPQTVEAQTCAITIAVNNSSMGTTSPTPGTYYYSEGDYVTITAIPYSGYYHVGWVAILNYLGQTYTDTIIDPTQTSISDVIEEDDIELGGFTIMALFSDDSTYNPGGNGGGGDSVSITYAVNDPTMGTTIPTPGTYNYADGDIFSVTAVPNTGYELVDWMVSVTYYGQTYTEAVGTNELVLSSEVDAETGDFTLTALFQPVGYVPSDTLTLNIAVNDPTMGTTSPVPGTYYYTEGDYLYISATPYEGYSFIGWVETVNYMGYVYSDTLFDPSMTIIDGVVDADIVGYTLTLTALFSDGSGPVFGDSVSLTFAVNDPTMGTTNPAPGTYYFEDGDVFSVTAIPYAGYKLYGWIATMTYMGETYTESLDTNALTLSDTVFAELAGVNIIITAIFGPESVNPDKLTVIVGMSNPNGGTVTPAPGVYYYDAGDQVTFDATANAGYNFTGWHITLTHPESGIMEDYIIDAFGLGFDVGEEMMGYVYTAIALFEGVEDIEDAEMVAVNAYCSNGQIVLNGAEGHEVYLFDLNGRMLGHTAKANSTETYSVPATGVYLVKVVGVETKRVVVLR